MPHPFFDLQSIEQKLAEIKHQPHPLFFQANPIGMIHVAWNIKDNSETDTRILTLTMWRHQMMISYFTYHIIIAHVDQNAIFGFLQVKFLNPILAGGGHWMAPPRKLGFSASGNEFWVTPNGWQFLSTYIFEDSFCFWDKNDLENVLEYHIWGKGQFLKILRRNKTFISEATELSEGWRHGF